MNATFRVLRAAAELDEFTVPMLVQHADAKDATVRSVLRRHPQFFEQMEASSTARRGGQTRLWRVVPGAREQIGTEVRGLAARYAPPSEAPIDSGDLGFRTRPQNTPELATADDLNVYSGWAAARQLLPELVQRLLVDARGLRELSIRTGNGVGLPGFDAAVETESSSPWIPAGVSVWELGAGSDPRAKAQADYRKRTDFLPAEERAQTTFVAVSMGRFREKEQWLRRRRLAAEWHDVRVIDADDLYDWLTTVPSAHVWASERMGLYPGELKTLERWWELWSNDTALGLPDGTHVTMPGGLLLAGRGQVSAELLNRLRQARARREAIVLNVSGPSRDEVIGFVASALAQWEGQFIGEAPIRALVVSTAREWERVGHLSGDAVLVPAFEDADVFIALSAGRCMVIPLGPGDPRNRADIVLPPIARDEASKALQNLGIPLDESYRLAGEARRSLSTFRRAKARNASRARPPWAQGEEGSLLAGLMLLGEWELEHDTDHEVVAAVAGCDYEQVERLLTDLRQSEDPPFVVTGDRWRLASPQDAWGLLHGRVTRAVVDRWREQAVSVLSEPDPTFGLSAFEIFMAPVRGIARRHSRALRRGIARALALVGAAEDDDAPDTQTWSHHATNVVSALLADGASAEVWLALRDVLPQLAEAAPDVFIGRANAATTAPSPVLKDLLVQRDDSHIFGQRDRHVELLWALEVLCWAPEHFGSTCEILARLAELDPAPKGSQRPAGTLRAVLLPKRHPQASTSVAERLAVIDGILLRHPVVGWSLLLSLLSPYLDSSSPTTRPEFRTWHVTQQGDVGAEMETLSHLTTRALEYLKQHPEGWNDFLEALTTLPPLEQNSAITALEQEHLENFTDETLSRLWSALSSFVTKHRQFQGAPWALDGVVLSRLESVVQRLEPAALPERFARLFDWHPNLPGTGTLDHKSYEAHLERVRSEAIQQVIREGGPGGLRALVLAAPVPQYVGWAIADAADDRVTFEMLAMLCDERSAQLAASAWLLRRANVYGVEATLGLRNEVSSEARVEFFLALPASGALWQCLEKEDSSVIDGYWRRVLARPVDDSSAEEFVEGLLEHDRPWTAIEVLALHVDRELEPRPDLVERTLVAATVSPGDDPLPTSADYEVGLLLDRLADVSTVDTLVQLEWAYFALLQHTRTPRVLFDHLRQEPDFFIQLVCAAFRASDEPTREVSDQERMVGQQSMLVLRDWRNPPGFEEDGSIGEAQLRTWVTRARAKLVEKKRVAIGEQLIGELLSATPVGADGIWPPEGIRDLLEESVGSDLGTGLAIGRFNAGDVTTRGMFEGGRQEDVLASRYDEWSRKTMARWPATGRLLREMASHYRNVARRFDVDAERWASE